MSFFMYFVPSEKGEIVPADLADAGLSYAVSKKYGSSGVRAGPNGKPGFVVIDGTPESSDLNYRSDGSQIWQKIPRSPTEAWVGMRRDARPGPEDLARVEQLRGEWVELGDGRQWLVPLARGVSGDDENQLIYYVALPSARVISDDGTWQTDGVLQRYQPLWDIASRYWDAVVEASGTEAKDQQDDGEVRFDFDGETNAAVTALQTNYRIGPVEASMLGLLNDLTIGKILNATIDLARATEWLKKKLASGGVTTAAG